MPTRISQQLVLESMIWLSDCLEQVKKTKINLWTWGSIELKMTSTQEGDYHVEENHNWGGGGEGRLLEYKGFEVKVWCQILLNEIDVTRTQQKHKGCQY